jgi:hypothetical protein
MMAHRKSAIRNYASANGVVGPLKAFTSIGVHVVPAATANVWLRGLQDWEVGMYVGKTTVKTAEVNGTKEIGVGGGAAMGAELWEVWAAGGGEAVLAGAVPTEATTAPGPGREPDMSKFHVTEILPTCTRTRRTQRDAHTEMKSSHGQALGNRWTHRTFNICE